MILESNSTLLSLLCKKSRRCSEEKGKELHFQISWLYLRQQSRLKIHTGQLMQLTVLCAESSRIIGAAGQKKHLHIAYEFTTEDYDEGVRGFKYTHHMVQYQLPPLWCSTEHKKPWESKDSFLNVKHSHVCLCVHGENVYTVVHVPLSLHITVCMFKTFWNIEEAHQQALEIPRDERASTIQTYNIKRYTVRGQGAMQKRSGDENDLWMRIKWMDDERVQLQKIWCWPIPDWWRL